jgi:hypothetical protein
MTSFTASITITMTDEEVMIALVSYGDRNRSSYSTKVNTIDCPYELCNSTCRDAPLNKTLWLECFSKALASKTKVLPSVRHKSYDYRNPVIDLDDTLKEAINAYYETDYYQKLYRTYWDAYSAKEKADAIEAERIRSDVPAITKLYEALLKEHEALKVTLVNRNRRLEYINGEVKDTKEAWAQNKTKPAVWLVKTIDNINHATDFHTPSTSSHY